MYICMVEDVHGHGLKQGIMGNKTPLLHFISRSSAAQAHSPSHGSSSSPRIHMESRIPPWGPFCRLSSCQCCTSASACGRPAIAAPAQSSQSCAGASCRVCADCAMVGRGRKPRSLSASRIFGGIRLPSNDVVPELSCAAAPKGRGEVFAGRWAAAGRAEAKLRKRRKETARARSRLAGDGLMAGGPESRAARACPSEMGADEWKAGPGEAARPCYKRIVSSQPLCRSSFQTTNQTEETQRRGAGVLHGGDA